MSGRAQRCIVTASGLLTARTVESVTKPTGQSRLRSSDALSVEKEVTAIATETSTMWRGVGRPTDQTCVISADQATLVFNHFEAYFPTTSENSNGIESFLV